jgi:hypothetical protein
MIISENVCGKQVVWYGVRVDRDLTLPFIAPNLF